MTMTLSECLAPSPMRPPVLRPQDHHLFDDFAFSRTLEPQAQPARELLLAALIDMLDHPVLVVDEAATLLLNNRKAHRLLTSDDALQQHDGQVRASEPAQRQRLGAAILSAARTHKRSLLPLGVGHLPDDLPATVAVVPLGIERVSPGPMAMPSRTLWPSCASAPVLLIVGRQRMCEPLSLDFFVRNHGITPAEAAMLRGLCAGATPTQLARDGGISLTTVRTHLARLRAKTDTRSVNELLRRVMALPPIVAMF